MNQRLLHFERLSIFNDTTNEHFITNSHCNQRSSSILQANTSSPLSTQWTQTGQDVQRHDRTLQMYCQKFFLGAPFRFFSNTQSEIAQSSRESELYAICSGGADARHIRSCFIEARLSETVTWETQTDSSSAEGIAMQYGTSRKTRHIKLRYHFRQDLVQSGLLKITTILGRRKLFRCVHEVSTSWYVTETYSTRWNYRFDRMSDLHGRRTLILKAVFFNVRRIQQ